MKVLLINDDRWHPGSVPADGVKPLEQSGFEFDVLGDGARFAGTDLRQYAVVILAKSDNRTAADESKWADTDARRKLIGYVRNGGGLLAVHSGTAGYAGLEDMHALLGGLFMTHPAQLDVTFEPAAGHRLTTGAQPFTVKDEHYFMDMAAGDADVFLTGKSRHGAIPAGWTRAEGLGRVCVLTPGHNPEVWQDKSFQRLLLNALNWCAGA